MTKPGFKKFGLLGYPVKHSFSPLIHNAALKQLHIPGRYELFEKKSSELESFFAGLGDENICGFNVTVPYKERVLSFIGQKSKEVSRIGAANTVVSQEGVLKAFNTDFFGFSRHLKELLNPAGAEAALLGAGGAAKAVSYALLNERAAGIYIYDIDRGKSAGLAETIKRWASDEGIDIKVEKAENIEELKINNKDLLINATPVGLNESDPPVVSGEFLHKGLAVYDLVYNPAKTKLLSAAEEKGCKFFNGLKMLIYQGARSFIHFTRTSAGIDKIVAIMEESLAAELKK